MGSDENGGATTEPPIRPLCDAAVTLPDKAAALVRLGAAGIAIPPGVVVPLAPLAGPAREAVAALLAQGPVIVRGALQGEDAADASGAGLSTTVPDCADLDAVDAALVDVDRGRRDAWVVRYRGEPDPGDRAIVQQQIAGAWTVVAAIPDVGATWIEAHRPGADALAVGRTPEIAGPVTTWDDPRAAALRDTVVRLRAAATADPKTDAPHGLDAELVVDDAGRWWVVQVRPLTRSLHPGWPAFVQAVAAEGTTIPGGTLTLDAEHNPAALSEAHAWLMRWLGERRPDGGAPTILAGWLYVRTLVRDLQPREHDTAAALAPRDALLHLRDDLLPAARERLERVEAAIATTDREAIAAALDLALQAFVAMIDAYLGVLVPARRKAARDGLTPVARPASPLSLRGREAFLDVLPVAWDVASPALRDVGARAGPSPASAEDAPLPDDPAEAATLLTEWDDHLFALGLAPVRRVYVRAGEVLGWGDDVFGLTGDELTALLAGAWTPADDERARRRARAQLRSELAPPVRIVDGAPAPRLPRRELEGIGVGPSYEGPLCPRTDLAHLLRDPPAPGSIAVLPALTAQAALALADLRIEAVCCAHGGALGHAALMARELGLSALIGCRGCVDLPAGTRVHLDTTAGRLRLLGPETQ